MMTSCAWVRHAVQESGTYLWLCRPTTNEEALRMLKRNFNWTDESYMALEVIETDNVILFVHDETWPAARKHVENTARLHVEFHTSTNPEVLDYGIMVYRATAMESLGCIVEEDLPT
jgi:hypothetical protein